MYVERMNVLLDMLKNHVKEEEFDLSAWFVQNNCGTVACVIGHAANYPYFQNLGLFIYMDKYLKKGYPILKIKDEKFLLFWSAVTTLFNIPLHEAHYLFFDFEYDNPTLKNVIMRIEDFINKHSEDVVPDAIINA